MSFIKGLCGYKTCKEGKREFGSSSTAEEVSEDIDLAGRTAIVTGGSSGIGAETVRVLALRGARVIIAARNLDAAEGVKKEIKKSIPHAEVECMKLDLSSLASIKKFADAFLATGFPLNLLINNAGVMMCPFQLSEDLIERQFATNHVGHFYLTELLLEKLKSTAKASGMEGRIVNVSSIAHRLANFRTGIRYIEDETWRTSDVLSDYGQSKLANILHAKELARRLKAERANVTANAVHPGFIKTNLERYNRKGTRLFRWMTFFIWKSIPQGASTTVYVAVHPSLKGLSGKYFSNCKEQLPSLLAENTQLAKLLWKYTEDLIENRLAYVTKL